MKGMMPRSRASARLTLLSAVDMKRIIALFLALIIIASFSACKNETETESTETSETDENETEVSVVEDETEKTLSLPYFSNDSMNPFKAAGKTNSSLSSLFCGSLFTLKSDYTPVPGLAEDFETDSKELTVKLKPDVRFSNGSTLSSADVVYSFNLAKESKIYSERLSVFSSAVSNGNSVVFNLSREDIYAVNCLDFPIIQTGTGSEDIVVGSGPYVLKKSGDSFSFKKNELFSFSDEYEYSSEKIRLYDMSDVSSGLYSLQIGNISYYYDDMATVEEKRVKINANTAVVTQNDLIYIGFNSASDVLTDAVKKAVNLSLSRESLTNSSFGSGAESANTPFNPLWCELENVKTNSFDGSSATAQEALLSGGYKISGTQAFSSDDQKVSLKLIAPSDDPRKVALAKDVKSAVQKASVNVELSLLSDEEFYLMLSEGYYDMYIGETRLSANMDLSSFLDEGGSLSFGIKDPTLTDGYYSFRSGNLDLQTFIGLFDERLPFIPICFVNGVAYYSRLLNIEEASCENNIYESVYSWDVL